MKISKGFTLIELLVVIAIIGILSSVVLASLTTARTKGQDAAVESQLSSMRSQAELYYSTNSNSYGPLHAVDACTAGAADLFGTGTNSLKALVAGVANNNNGGSLAKTACVSSLTAWAVSATLPSLNTSAFCVDSTGTSKVKPGLTADTPSGAITGQACN